MVSKLKEEKIKQIKDVSRPNLVPRRLEQFRRMQNACSTCFGPPPPPPFSLPSLSPFHIKPEYLAPPFSISTHETSSFSQKKSINLDLVHCRSELQQERFESWEKKKIVKMVGSGCDPELRLSLGGGGSSSSSQDRSSVESSRYCDRNAKKAIYPSTSISCFLSP